METGEMRRLLQRALKHRLFLIGVAMALLFQVMALVPGLFTPRDPYAVDTAIQVQAPSVAHRLGTDGVGRDLWARIAWGSRNSLGVAVSSVAGGLAVGGILGLLSGFMGGLTDQLLGRVMDVIFSFPAMLLAVVVAGILGPGLGNAILALGVVFIPIFYRVVRGSVIAERDRDYVEAARALGVPTARIMWRHILPNVLAPVIVQTAVQLCYAIILEAALSYLGLGTQPPYASWGTILNEGRSFLTRGPWISFFPGLAIFGAVLSFNLVGDGLRDILDPRLKNTR
jgi:peptide/nickel transport system permease protein